MITLEDYFGKVSHKYEPNDLVKTNAEILLSRVNAIMVAIKWKPAINSGWRPAEYNATIPNAAPRSKHITGQAIDIDDPTGELDKILFNNQYLLRKYELWMEHPAATRGWCHLQSVPPRSGNLVFFP
jgi:hypothetical protein